MISYASNRTQAQIKVIRQSMEDASPWFHVLTDVNGDLILTRLKKEAA